MSLIACVSAVLMADTRFLKESCSETEVSEQL